MSMAYIVPNTSDYLCWRLILWLTFSSPFKIPERTKLNRSTGSMILIKCNRTSTCNDAKCMVGIVPTARAQKKIHTLHACASKPLVSLFQNQSTTMFILMFVCLFRLVKELTLAANVIIVMALMQTNSFLNLHNLTQIFNNTAYCL